MNRYLLLHCGPYRLLLDIGQVVEVADAPAASRDVHFRRLWRDTQLTGIDLAAYLGATPAGRRQQIVLRDEEGTLSCIDVDRVESLCELADADFTAIAGVSERLQQLMDAVALDRDNEHCLLRLRRPFAWHAVETAQGEVHE